MTGSATYQVPEGPLCLAGPIARPAPGALPLRGDLAHIALAGTHLAAHYVIPEQRKVNGGGAQLRLTPQVDAESLTTLDAGALVEVLDIAGDWAWACLGPQGPAGYVECTWLAPLAE